MYGSDYRNLSLWRIKVTLSMKQEYRRKPKIINFYLLFLFLIFNIGTNINKIIDDIKVTIKLLVNVFKKSITVKLLIIISGK